MGLGTNSSYWSSKAEISNFISQVAAFFFQKNVFWFDISMNEILLVDTLEAFHDFNDDLGSLLKGEGFTG